MNVELSNSQQTANYLIVYPDSILSKPSERVEIFDTRLNQLIIEMFGVLEKLGGAGLSACQVNIDKSLFVYKTPEVQGVMINPALKGNSNGSVTEVEGCLSLPGLFLPVSRFAQVTISFQDENGQEKIEEFGGLLARIVQHEMDHLAGKTILYHTSKLKRDIITKKLLKLQKQYSQIKEMESMK